MAPGRGKRILGRLLMVVAGGYIAICVALYFMQEKLLFHPDVLSRDLAFGFDQPFEELFIKTIDGPELNGLLFKADSAKGLIFYLHGNGGALDTWGNIAHTYTDLGYDLFMLDYPGYGKSTGSIESEGQLYRCIQTAYDSVKSKYDGTRMVVLGYSIGTGPAAKLASENNADMLVLQAPYHSMTDLVDREFPLIPGFILKYPLKTNEHLKACAIPVLFIHGDQDKVIPYSSSVALMEEAKPGDRLVTLHGWGHNRFTDSPEYMEAIQRILE